jgi:hypothetical protein
VGRLSKIKRELIQEANRRLLVEQDIGEHCSNYDCGIVDHLDMKRSIWPYEYQEPVIPRPESTEVDVTIKEIGSMDSDKSIVFVKNQTYDNNSYWKDDEWKAFGNKTINEAMDIIRDSENKQHACSLKVTLTSMVAKKNYKKAVEGTTLLGYIDELCDIISKQFSPPIPNPVITNYTIY